MMAKRAAMGCGEQGTRHFCGVGARLRSLCGLGAASGAVNDTERGGDVLHERARVLRVALATLQKHVRRGVMLEGEMTTKANSLIPLGAGLMVGLTARPYVTRRQEMIV